ncbi:hypothetical protein ACVWYN_001765 [Pedobacter sp. UYP24]
MQNQTNTFFTKEVYDEDIQLDVNDDVLERIHNDGVKPTDQLPIEFVFITDTEGKAKSLERHISSSYPNYTGIKVEETDDYWEIHGNTDNIQMNIDEINKWNQNMCDFGYDLDCLLDGWQVLSSD